MGARDCPFGKPSNGQGGALSGEPIVHHFRQIQVLTPTNACVLFHRVMERKAGTWIYWASIAIAVGSFVLATYMFVTWESGEEPLAAQSVPYDMPWRGIVPPLIGLFGLMVWLAGRSIREMLDS